MIKAAEALGMTKSAREIAQCIFTQWEQKLEERIEANAQAGKRSAEFPEGPIKEKPVAEELEKILESYGYYVRRYSMIRSDTPIKGLLLEVHW